MKKFLATICAAALLFTGCGGEEKVADKPNNNFSAAELKLGMITRLNTDEKSMGDTLDKVAESFGVKGTKHLPKFYDSLSVMQMGIESGSIDQISLYSSVGKYLIDHNDKYAVVGDDAMLKSMTDNFCFAVRKDDTALKADLDKIIDEMKADGSLDKLINDYITNVDKDKNPPAVEIPVIDGADKIKVGVTGDLPPLDLILPDNSPAGFNTALLAEVAKRLNKNIEIVQIDSGARAAALSADQIDVIFWAIVPVGDFLSKNIDKPDGIALSEPYFQDEIAHIKLKK